MPIFDDSGATTADLDVNDQASDREKFGESRRLLEVRDLREQVPVHA